MELKNKKILLVGLAKTGIATIKCLNKLGAKILVNDIKDSNILKDILIDLKDLENIEYVLGYHPEKIDDIDLVVVSPGVPLDLPFIIKLKENNIKIIGEIELAYCLSNNPCFIGITGTNGKTTTTSLTGEIFKQAKYDTYIVGNIGNPMIEAIETANENSVLVSELSSFQLETIYKFKPSISAIINITEDHLNRHHTVENYINAKASIMKNQNEDDFTILNYDDLVVRNLSSKLKSKVIFVSRKEKLDCGVYLNDNNDIVINIDKEIVLMNKNELSLPGEHNLENAMVSLAIAYLKNIDLEIIKNVLRTFSGVEHRQEFVKEINGISFVNDSKATNPDSTIKAIQSYSNPIILIAGGLNKHSDFNELLDIAKDKVKALIVLGETADSISLLAKEKGFKDIFKVNSISEAVSKSYDIAKEKDIVLLSPACASWDMYKNFEERGYDFKNNVYKLV